MDADDRSLSVAMWTMILLQTMASVDMPGSGPRKMPSPRSYVPVVVSFVVLDLVADSGHGRAAKAMAWVSVLAALVLGPFGIRLANFFNSVAQSFSPAPFTGG